MKGSVFTGRTWVLLSATLLLVVAGALNLSQRLNKNQSPPSDGVTWIDTAQGVIAKAIEPDSAAAHARIVTLGMRRERFLNIGRGDLPQVLRAPGDFGVVPGGIHIPAHRA